jgi:hypothetical protein
MAVFDCDLKIDQGGDLVFTTPPWVVNGAIVDLTGTTADFDIFVHSYDVAPMLSVSTTPSTSGSAIPNGTAGTVTVTLTNVATRALLATIGPLRLSLWSNRTGAVYGVPAIAVTVPGTGYTSAPAVAITGGSGAGATATATVSGGAVTAVTVVDPGAGYLTAPSVGFSGGGGSSAAATASISLLPLQTLLQSGRVFITGTQASDN